MSSDRLDLRLVALAAAALVALSGAGCTNVIDGRLGSRDSTHSPGDPAGTPQPAPGGNDPALVPSPAMLHRLTLGEYKRTLSVLIGPEVRISDDLEVDTPLHGFTTVGAASLSIGPRAAEQYEASALDVAQQIFASDARRRAFVGCAPASAEDPCVGQFLAAFGRRAWRRPLTDAELARYKDLVSTVAVSLRSPWSGLEMAVAGMLQSPSFLYRVEVGEPDPDLPGRLRYTSLEMASRLSYLITGTTPDARLLDAAERGDLASKEGVAAEARRLLALPFAKSALWTFFFEHLKLDRLLQLSKDRAMFPQMSATLGESMEGEVRRLIGDVVFERDADFRELFDSRTTFVNDELARLYNLPELAEGGARFEPIRFADNSPRGGLLTTGAILALNAHETMTSPTYRGRFIRQSVLCQEIPPPPPGVNTTLPATDPGTPQTLRQRLESLHLQDRTCAGCHLRMDPLGFGLENFDAIGAYRTTENGLPIDPRGTLDGNKFNSARELAALVRDHPSLTQCLARRVYRYATGHLEGDAELPAVNAIARAFEGSGFRFQELIVALVTNDGFRYAGLAE